MKHARLDTDQYCVSAACYAKRARELLQARDPAALHHAAFELVHGVNGRQREYDAAHQSARRRVRSDWRVTKLAPELKPIFVADRPARLRFAFATGEPVISLTYAPVTKELIRKSRLLAKVLEFREAAPSPEELHTTYELAVSACAELEVACSGTVVRPEDMRFSEASLHMAVKLPTELVAVLDRVLRNGHHYFVDVEYVERVER